MLVEARRWAATRMFKPLAGALHRLDPAQHLQFARKRLHPFHVSVLRVPVCMGATMSCTRARPSGVPIRSPASFRPAPAGACQSSDRPTSRHRNLHLLRASSTVPRAAQALPTCRPLSTGLVLQRSGIARLRSLDDRSRRQLPINGEVNGSQLCCAQWQHRVPRASACVIGLVRYRWVVDGC